MNFTQSDIARLSKQLHQSEPLRPSSGGQERTIAEVGARGDHDLNPGTDLVWDSFATREASVLVGITDDPTPNVVLTQRAKTLSKHAGEISFPGGRRDGAETAFQTAIREAEEEIALGANQANFLGYLDPYYTTSKYRIVPVVVEIDAKTVSHFVPNAGEVEDIFTVPLEFLLDFENHQQHAVEWQGIPRHYYAMPWNDRYIWGATAGMLRNLAVRWQGRVT